MTLTITILAGVVVFVCLGAALIVGFSDPEPTDPEPTDAERMDSVRGRLREDVAHVELRKRRRVRAGEIT